MQLRSHTRSTPQPKYQSAAIKLVKDKLRDMKRNYDNRSIAACKAEEVYKEQIEKDDDFCDSDGYYLMGLGISAITYTVLLQMFVLLPVSGRSYQDISSGLLFRLLFAHYFHAVELLLQALPGALPQPQTFSPRPSAPP